MAYLAAGYLCLFLAMRAEGQERLGAAILAVAAFAAGFLVYPWWFPPAAAAGAGGLAFIARRMAVKGPARWILVAVGAALVAFALVGPADGLF
jgi:hypothetical protein